MKQYDLQSVKKQINECFKAHNIDSYETDYLLSEVFDCKITELMLIDKISKTEYSKICGIVKKRIKGKPLTKIFKRAYFYNNKFYINDNVLSCRPETELVIDEFLKLNKPKDIKVLDLCCGSGCIGLTVSTLGYKNVTLADVSEKALYVAKKNNMLLSQNAKIVKSDLFRTLHEKYDVILSNPPYIKTQEINNLDAEVRDFDPYISLNGGEDGLYFYKKIILNLNNYLAENGVIIFEIGFDEAEQVTSMFDVRYDVKVIKDYSNNDRVIVAKRR